jgi:capsular polysaccharide biosynthesis protein
MGEQAIDLRSTMSILRRDAVALIAAGLLGAAAGGGYVVLKPPLYSSTSQVLLPAEQSPTGMPMQRDVATEVRVANSDVVLDPVVEKVTPDLSLRQLRQRLTISAPTSDVLQIVARGEDRKQAEAIAQAVAEAEVAYVGKSSSSLSQARQAALQSRLDSLNASLKTVNDEVDRTKARQRSEDPRSVEGRADARAMSQLTAQQASLVLQIDQIQQTTEGADPTQEASIISNASPGHRPGLVSRLIIFGLIGLLLVGGLTAWLLVLFGRRDRRLRFRDQIADALGSPVIASVTSKVPRAAAGWRDLLSSYEPGTVDAWALRQTLRELAFGDGPLTATAEQQEGRGHSITVITLSDDNRGLAMGPQLASYAASIGIRTRLVAAGRHESAAPLWAACYRSKGEEELRPGLVVGEPTRSADADLTVVLVVVDRRSPDLGQLEGSETTVVALSPGSATAEELARTAVTADDAGSRITGMIVADPDDLDRTTGRLLQHERAQQVPLPTRLTGLPGTKDLPDNVQGLTRRPG